MFNSFNIQGARATVKSHYIEAGYNENPLIAKCEISPRVLNALFSFAYNDYTVISKEYAGPFDFDMMTVCLTVQF